MIKIVKFATRAAVLLCLAGIVTAVDPNPVVTSPKNMTYTAGDTMEITWTNATTGYVNIDVVSINQDVLQFPLMIASGVSSQEGKYEWKVPAELKTATGYYVRVWGSHQPTEKGNGSSQYFTVLNKIPGAVNTFVVLTPNKEKPCALGSDCQITWDYPLTSNYPAMVDIRLYRVGNPVAILDIATVGSTLKSYTWTVPQDPTLMAGDVYISVSGQGIPVTGPGMSNDMGGNSNAFIVAEKEVVVVVSSETTTTTSCSSTTESTSSTSTTTSRVSGAAKMDKNASAAPFATSELVKFAAIAISLVAMIPLALIL